MIIGISGLKGHGKDTFGAILVKLFGYTRMAFADPLRAELQQAFNSGNAPDDAPDRVKELVPQVIAAREGKPNPWEKPTLPDMRELLQLWGTEYRRAQHSGYWIAAFADSMKSKKIVVTDMRFPNEYAFIRSRSGVVVRIIRSSVASDETSKHSSEWLLDNFPFHYQINNDGPIWLLYVKAVLFVIRLMWWKPAFFFRGALK